MLVGGLVEETKTIRELFRPALARWKAAAGGEDAGSCEEQGEKFLHRPSPPKGKFSFYTKQIHCLLT